MNIAYLGDSHPASTARQRSQALERLGHQIKRFDPWTALTARRPSRFDYHSGYRWLQRAYLKALRRWLAVHAATGAEPLALIWVDSGEWFGPAVLNLLKQVTAAPVVLYQVDDCTGHRDRRRFASLRQALPFYDLCVTVRGSTELEMRALGARRTLLVWRSHDEIAHGLGCDDGGPNPRSDLSLVGHIAFIGTRIPGEGRDRVLLRLQRAGIPLVLWGSRWQRSRFWSELKGCHRGDCLSGVALCQAMAAASACLGLLSRGNRDLHTTRSLEVPAAGGLLCAQRTSEHALLFDDGEEALLWSNDDDCLRQCQRILSDPLEADRIRRAGCARLRRHGLGNEDICRHILAELLEG